MRPRGLRSKWVKVRPWYFIEKRQPAREQEAREALEAERRASQDTKENTAEQG